MFLRQSPQARWESVLNLIVVNIQIRLLSKIRWLQTNKKLACFFTIVSRLHDSHMEVTQNKI